MFPTQKVLDEEKGIEDLTMLLKIKPNKLSEDLITYVRDALMSKWKDTEEYKLLMVSTPRLVKFEQEVLEFSIRFLETYAKNVLCKRSSLEKDN